MRYIVDNKGHIDGVSQVSSPNFDQRPVASAIDTLVIHAISLPPDQFGGTYISELFTNCLDPNQHPYFADICELRVSSHFLISRSGEVTQFVSTYDRAWHAGMSSFLGRDQVNDFSIGIELEGCDTQPFEMQQYQSLAEISTAIMQTHTAITTDRIVGHSDIAPGRKTDPGPCFEWGYYRDLLGKSLLQ